MTRAHLAGRARIWRPAAAAAVIMALAVVALCALVPSAAFAVEPDEILSDPKLEARARTISAGLRCLVCQNQSIDDSNAPLARDLRILVRERLQAGDTDTAVRQFVVARYGEFVLLRPPFSAGTLLLWLGPPALLLATLAGLLLYSRRTRSARDVSGGAAVPTLTPDEEARLANLLADDGAGANADVPGGNRAQPRSRPRH